MFNRVCVFARAYFGFYFLLLGGLYMSKRRHKLSKRGSRKLFTRTAGHVHKRNMLPLSSSPMRGGIRL